MPATSPTTVTRADLDRGFERLGLRDVQIAIVHASLSAFGWVEGGALTVIDALRDAVPTIVVPAFVYASQLPTPPGMNIPNNSDHALAADWSEFRRALDGATSHWSDLPLDKDMGAVALELARRPDAVRSPSALGGFAGLGPRAAELMARGTPPHPLNVLEAAAAAGGWVLLLGADHTSNTTIHVAEHLEHRGRFTRFARVDDRPEGWVAVHKLGGQSDAFGAIEPHLRSYTREAEIGAAHCQAVPGSRVIEVTRRLIRSDPTALLDRSAAGRAAAAVAQRLTYLARLAHRNPRR